MPHRGYKRYSDSRVLVIVHLPERVSCAERAREEGADGEGVEPV
jgi:hypothetical protein